MNTQTTRKATPPTDGISLRKPGRLLRPGASRGAEKALKGPDDERLKKACADFEGILLNFMVQNMKKTLPEGGLFPKSHQSDVYESMFFQEISSKLARERGIGIGDALYRQASKQISADGKK
ncbi:MAG: hypothetical protein C4530_20620 [Desulfobacteraceae bacterium]|nr:MAG: hypothetical protein C4530_20620 [Desulfobacteraceae bacterium]